MLCFEMESETCILSCVHVLLEQSRATGLVKDVKWLILLLNSS